MDNLWPDTYPWDNLLEEDPIYSFQPSLLGHDSQPFPTLLSWLDTELNFYETNTCLIGFGEDFARSSEVYQYYEINDTSSIQDPVFTTASKSRVSSPSATEPPQVLTPPSEQKHFTDYLFEFEGVPSQILRRKRRRFSPVRRKEVDQLRKVGACIRCRLTKSPVWFRQLYDSSALTDKL